MGEIVLMGHGRYPSKLRITVADPFFIRLEDRLKSKASKR
jgi:hypothetical protein